MGPVRQRQANQHSSGTDPARPPSASSGSIYSIVSRKKGLIAFAVIALVVGVILVRLVFGTSEPAVLVDDGRLRAIQIEVLNGTNETGLALRITQHLRGKGFDVVEMGNLRTQDLAQSRVIDRAGNLEAAKQVAAALGLPDDRIEKKPDPTLYLDVSVHIGNDYASMTPFLNTTTRRERR